LSYVDGYIDREKDVINIVERVGGERKFVQYPAKYTFYYPDPKGKYTSIFGEPLTKVVCNTSKQFSKEKKLYQHKKLYESDINPVFRCLEENYDQTDSPDLNLAFFDIEVAFDKELGFAPPEDPFNMVTAVGIHLNWIGKTICLVIKPDTLTEEQAADIVNKFPDTLLMESEAELLLTFLDLIDDVDVMSGWNSTGFDIPYMVNRIARVLGKDYTRRFCLWGLYPSKRKYEQYGKEYETYDLTGRQHLDYLELYRKYTYHEMHSYSLDAISEYELGEKKIAYSGTLDQLYNHDFYTFIDYNRQDVELLVKLDQKLQFIDLANVIAHDNRVLLPTVLGSVAQIDQAIVNEAHARGMIIPDRDRSASGSGDSVAGAYVAVPKKGMHEWIASIDLNSLYPSILRALNMSPETLVGQIRQTLTSNMLTEFESVPQAWDGKFAALEYELVMKKDREQILHVDFENGETIEATGAEIHQMIFHNSNPWMLTSNGTIFTTERKGVIPGLLERWYSERKSLQKKAKRFKALSDGIELPERLR
jgi:DNA polymerase elongation subunit (family B)